MYDRTKNIVKSNNEITKDRYLVAIKLIVAIKKVKQKINPIRILGNAKHRMVADAKEKPQPKQTKCGIE